MEDSKVVTILIITSEDTLVNLFQKIFAELPQFVIKSLDITPQTSLPQFEETVDIIFLDFPLSDPNGIKLLTQVSTAMVTVPIILLAETELDWDNQEFLQQKAQDYLVKKDIDNLVLLQKVIQYATTNKYLEQLSHRSKKEMEQFTYAISHDLREPLRMISSYLKLLERKYKAELDAKADKYIYYAVDGATRMQQLLDDLLKLSRLTTRGQPFELVDCEDIFDQALRKLKKKIEEKNAKISKDSLPPLIVDSQQLEQVFHHLLSNALKFCEEEPQIQLTVEQVGKIWRFALQDNGIGLRPEQLEQVFIIFKKLHSPKKYSGNGIGLTLCKKIIERHGGQIWVESQPNQGSTFYFTIPVSPLTTSRR